MQIQIINADKGNWYRSYVDSVFDVELNGSGQGFVLIYTPRNENILRQEKDTKRREELLRRLMNVKSGYRLGVNGYNATRIIEGSNNKDFKTLLGQEW
jgi:hypothetical protein